MTKVTVLCLVVFFKLVLLAELPAMRERRTNKAIFRGEEERRLTEIVTSEYVHEHIDNLLNEMQCLYEALNEKQQEIEKLNACLNEKRKQFKQGNPVEASNFKHILKESVKLEGIHVDKLENPNEKYSNPNKLEDSVQITVDTGIDRSDE